ncbi:PEGA domain-containing protein [Myxococcota bacterium]|nr:PEGA domain-containing protein [Myxococcota bacterium]
MHRHPKMLWWIWFFFCGVSVMCSTSAPLRANQASLESLYQNGKRLVVQKEYNEALRVFGRVLVLMQKQEQAQTTAKQREHWRQQRARLLYVIGRTSEYASLWADAYRAYRGSESLKPSDAMRNAIRKRIQALLSHIPATLTLHTEPEQAEIELIDAQGRVHQGKSPLKLTLPPGSTTFSIQQKGYETRKRRLSLDPLQHTQLFLELLPLQTAQQSNAPPSTSWRVPVAWASVGMGLASSIASIALIAVSQQQLAAYDAQRASPKATAQFALDPERFVDPLRSAQSTEAASIGTFAGACVFFGLAAALLFWSPPKPPSTAALPSPTSFLPAPSTSPIVATSPPLPQRLYRIP